MSAHDRDRLDTLRRAEQAKAVSDSRWIAFKFCLYAVLFVGGLVLCGAGFFVGLHLSQVPDLGFLENYNPVQSIQIYDYRDRLLMSVEGAEKRRIIKIKDVSPNLIKSVLAAEDHKFYEHHGVRPESVLRAVMANVSHGRTVEGGSTITQQLVKNLFFEGEKRTLDLKVAELLVALNMENRLSKDKILELYLNEVYFGNNSYGIEQAARNYFGKRAADLTLSESAFLAGIIRSPSSGGLLENRVSAMERQREVIDKMLNYGFVTAAQAEAAKFGALTFNHVGNEKPKLSIPKYPYYVSAVLEQVKKKYSDAFIERNGMKIYTNLDPVAQEAAEQTLSSGIRNAPYGVNQGALVSMRVSDGAIVALVGGVGDYLENQWNCATNPHTAGSCFKPFVYLAAFEKNAINENSYICDTPLTITTDEGTEYKPKNFDGKFMGEITVAKAVAFSRNVCAIRAAQLVGVPAIMDAAMRAGIKENLAPHISLALGCSAVTPIEMAAAYATFARGGEYIGPMLIRRVETKTGRHLKTYHADRYTAFDHAAVAQIVDVLQDVVEHGTGQLARLGDRPCAGKTGTADKGRDLWFVGFTPELSTAVWAGNKDNKPVAGSQVTGGTVMAGIWRQYNQKYYRAARIASGLFPAANRGPAFFAPDRAAAAPVSQAVARSEYSSSDYRPARRRRPAYSAYRGGKQAPAGGSIRRADSGVTEYSWSRR